DSALLVVAGEAHFALDTAQPVVRNRLPNWLAHAIQGTASGSGAYDDTGPTTRFSLDVRGKNLAWRHLGLDRVHARGQVDGATYALDALHIQSGDSALDVHGTCTLLPDARTLLGRHDLTLSSPKLALRRLVGPFVPRPGLLPETVRMNVRTRGRSLWPVTSEVQLDLDAWGVPASWLPGVPDPLVVRGTAIAHPDMVEVLRLQIGSRTSQIALQGAVPYDKLGVIDLYKSLHRIPEKASRLEAAD
ncbi:MAG TPA: hypothetical protein VFH51_18250, partial [Myxococcota bacterium]|nr:hypothetical protein [Myxococcota bacterium]